MNLQFMNRIFWGLVMVLVGVWFLLSQAGMLPDIDLGQIVADFWPVLIIYFSAIGLFFQRRMKSGWIGSYFWNLVGIAIGFYFLGRNLGYIHMSIGDFVPYIIPVLLIVFGLNMLFRPKASSSTSDHVQEGDWRQQKQQWKEQKAEWKRQKDEWKQQNKRQQKCRVEEPIVPQPVESVIPPMGPDEPVSVGDFDEKFEERFGSLEGKESKKEEASEAQDPASRAKGGNPVPPVAPPPPPTIPPSSNTTSSYARFEPVTGPNVENRSGMIGDVKIGQDYFDLKPMNISHFIGDTVIDLTKAYIPQGETKINISSFIGDVKIFIPNDLDLEICVISSSFLGSNTVLDRHEGGLFKNMNIMPHAYQEADKRIRIHVSVFIGDLRVQRVG